MTEEPPVTLNWGLTLRTFFYSQFFGTPTYPDQSFAGQTIIVTGSNVGLGLEAARHFYRLNCARLILAVRTVKKGEAAKEDIVRSVTHRSDGASAIDVWTLDLASTDSTLAFAERVKQELSRLDIVVENAGIVEPAWKVSEGFELAIQVNVINTLLLGMVLLPKMRETKQKFRESMPHLEIVSSEAHHFSKFKEVDQPDIYATLNDEKQFDRMDRYNVSKLLEILFIRELVSVLKQSSSDPAPVTMTLVNPGMCHSDVDRNMPQAMRAIMFCGRFFLARTTEVGSRTLVHGACAGSSSHGEYMSDGRNQDVQQWIYSDRGKRAQVKVFEQTMKVLESRQPGIGQVISS